MCFFCRRRAETSYPKANTKSETFIDASVKKTLYLNQSKRSSLSTAVGIMLVRKRFEKDETGYRDKLVSKGKAKPGEKAKGRSPKRKPGEKPPTEN